VSGSFHAIDGIPHFLSATAAAHLLSVEPFFELVWASGWEEKANDYLPHLLGLPAELPFLRFARSGGPGTSTHGHWKLDAIDAYAGERALAWVDDALDASCHAWAAARSSPTLLVGTRPERGLTGRETRRLLEWAGQAVLMSNASQELRSMAKMRGWKQAPPNDQDGVAVVLEAEVARFAASQA